MKRCLAVLFIVLVVLTATCLADGFDLSNMTTQQLNQLKSDISKQLEADHDATSSEESRVESAVKSYVEDYYGEANVSWAWFDYSYTKEWDYFTMSTHADVKKGNETTRCNIFADIYRMNDNYKIAYLVVGNDELINARDEIIDDQRVRAMLGLFGTTDKNPTTTDPASTVKSAEGSGTQNTESPTNFDSEPNSTDATVIAKLGDKNETVKEIQSMLIRLGYLKGNADGDFGKRTKAAIINFQSDNGLKQTGTITQEVYTAIKKASEAVPEPATYERYTAKEVYSKYESNEIAGDSEFKGKIIEVTGNVDEVGTSMFGTPYVYLKADSYGFNLLHFEFSRNDKDQLASLKENQTITIRAKCTGWSIIAVYFDDSEIV